MSDEAFLKASREKSKKYMKSYRKTPKNQAYRKAYRATEEYKARQKVHKANHLAKVLAEENLPTIFY